MRRWAALTGIALTSAMALGACALPASQDEVLPTRFVEPATITPAAEKAFGAQAKEAYNEIVEWSMSQWLRDPLLNPEDTVAVTAQNISLGITDHMIPGTARTWNAITEQAISGDEKARHAVQLLRFHDWYEAKLQKPGGSPIRSQAINRGFVDVAPAWKDGVQPMRISFQQTARIELLNRRDPYPATVTKEVTFTLVPASSVKSGTSTTTSAATASATSTATSPVAAAAASGTRAPAAAAVTSATMSPSRISGTVPMRSRSTSMPSGAPSIGTLNNSANVVNPTATWLIAAFDGDIEINFDKDRTPRPSGTGSATVEDKDNPVPTATGSAPTAPQARQRERQRQREAAKATPRPAATASASRTATGASDD